MSSLLTCELVVNVDVASGDVRLGEKAVHLGVMSVLVYFFLLQPVPLLLNSHLMVRY